MCVCVCQCVIGFVGSVRCKPTPLGDARLINLFMAVVFLVVCKCKLGGDVAALFI